MRPRIADIFKQLKEFDAPENLALVVTLSDIAHTTEDNTERDQAIELMLFCEANENGPLGMSSREAIEARFNSTFSNTHSI
jgi:hypothetical protein